MKEIFENPVVAGAIVNLTVAVVAAVGALTSNVLYKLSKSLKEKTEQIKSEKTQILLNTALDAADELVEKTVASIEQTVAKALREEVKEGVKSREELLKLSSQAFVEIYEQLAPEYIEAINGAFGSFSKYLTNAIETKVLLIKS